MCSVNKYLKNPYCVPGTVHTVGSKTEGSAKVIDLNLHLSQVGIYWLYLLTVSAKKGCEVALRALKHRRNVGLGGFSKWNCCVPAGRLMF